MEGARVMRALIFLPARRISRAPGRAAAICRKCGFSIGIRTNNASPPRLRLDS